jgi:hypothetical protein
VNSINALPTSEICSKTTMLMLLMEKLNFKHISSLQHQVTESVFQKFFKLLQRQRQQVLPKCWYLSTKRHGVRAKKTNLNSQILMSQHLQFDTRLTGAWTYALAAHQQGVSCLG